MKIVLAMSIGITAWQFVSAAGAHEWHRDDDLAFLFHRHEPSGTKMPSGHPAATAAAAGNLCAQYLPAFDRLKGHVEVSCQGDELIIRNRTGLPPAPKTEADRIMVGITAWIQRLPVPFDYLWRLPLHPRWRATPENASPKGPIAVAIDGVPVFHYDRRPDADTSYYQRRHDTVIAGELDQCGGHAGQGDDYHYHYAPVCLVDKNALDRPIAFGLDGAPVYFGTGGDDYYGRGRTKLIDNLPREPLDACNAVKRSDGSYVHYTTREPPYVIGCHHGSVDRRRKIEPRPMAGRRQRTPSPLGIGQVGEAVRTLITDFSLGADGWYRMEFEALSGSGTGAVLFRRASSGAK
ncbi:MAG: YHYH protein, partial [Hyphomicrobiales bacterium]|nr:YHYH protein [Hyphomicrobiales bacterium]